MIAKALICYALSVLIAVASVFLLCFYFKKIKMRFSFIHMAVGTLSFIGVTVCMIALIMFAFSDENITYMKAIMSERSYKIAIAVILFTLICIVRYFILNAVYFSRDKEAQGTSFLAGYGFGGVFIIAVYCLFSFIYLAFAAATSDFVVLTSESVFRLSDNTVISVFTPFESHILITVIFAVYTALMLVTAQFMTQHASLPYKWHHTLIMFLLTSFCEICMTCIFLFTVSKIHYIAIIIIAVILAALSALSVNLLYRYKEDLPYHNQFD